MGIESKRKRVYVGWITLLFTWNWPNIENQQYFNWKGGKKKVPSPGKSEPDHSAWNLPQPEGQDPGRKRLPGAHPTRPGLSVFRPCRHWGHRYLPSVSLDAGGDGATEDKMVGWHHRRDTWVWASFKSWNGQGSLVCAVHGITKSQTQLKWLSTALLPFELQGQTCLLFRVSLRLKKKNIFFSVGSRRYCRSS